jgi:hypothetical protein
MLRDIALDTLFRVICDRLAHEHLEPVNPTEGETAYTRRAVLPIVSSVIAQADVPALLLGGPYTGINRPVRYLGVDFHPDIAVFEHERRLIAIEVKFLGGADRSGMVSKSLGQTTVYKLAGYRRGITLLLDKSNKLRPHHLRHAEKLSTETGTLALIPRLRGARGFREGAILYPTA